MLPGNVLSNPAIPGGFIPPKNQPKSDLTDLVEGGISIGDASQGLQVQDWGVSVNGSNHVIFTPHTSGSPVDVLTLSGTPNWIAGCFDQSMRVFVAYTIGLVSHFYWYDSTIPGYTTTALPAPVAPSLELRPFCVLDDYRQLELATSDIILSYVNGGNLYYRQQRDRYLIEYNLANIGTETLVQTGMSTVNRFQFEFFANNPF